MQKVNHNLLPVGNNSNQVEGQSNSRGHLCSKVCGESQNVSRHLEKSLCKEWDGSERVLCANFSHANRSMSNSLVQSFFSDIQGTLLITDKPRFSVGKSECVKNNKMDLTNWSLAGPLLLFSKIRDDSPYVQDNIVKLQAVQCFCYWFRTELHFKFHTNVYHIRLTWLGCKSSSYGQIRTDVDLHMITNLAGIAQLRKRINSDLTRYFGHRSSVF